MKTLCRISLLSGIMTKFPDNLLPIWPLQITCLPDQFMVNHVWFGSLVMAQLKKLIELQGKLCI